MSQQQQQRWSFYLTCTYVHVTERRLTRTHVQRILNSDPEWKGSDVKLTVTNKTGDYRLACVQSPDGYYKSFELSPYKKEHKEDLVTGAAILKELFGPGETHTEFASIANLSNKYYVCIHDIQEKESGFTVSSHENKYKKCKAYGGFAFISSPEVWIGSFLQPNLSQYAMKEILIWVDKYVQSIDNTKL